MWAGLASLHFLALCSGMGCFSTLRRWPVCLPPIGGLASALQPPSPSGLQPWTGPGPWPEPLQTTARASCRCSSLCGTLIPELIPEVKVRARLAAQWASAPPSELSAPQGLGPPFLPDCEPGLPVAAATAHTAAQSGTHVSARRPGVTGPRWAFGDSDAGGSGAGLALEALRTDSFSRLVHLLETARLP